MSQYACISSKKQPHAAFLLAKYKADEILDVIVIVLRQFPALKTISYRNLQELNIKCYHKTIHKSDNISRKSGDTMEQIRDHLKKSECWRFNEEDKSLIPIYAKKQWKPQQFAQINPVQNKIDIDIVKALAKYLEIQIDVSLINTHKKMHSPDLKHIKAKFPSKTAVNQKQEEFKLFDTDQNEYVQLDKVRKAAFKFNEAKVTKRKDGDYEKNEVNLLGKSNLNYVSEYKIKINKLTKEKRDPVLWVGFADSKLSGQVNIQNNRDAKIIAMSDQHKLYKINQFILYYKLEQNTLQFRHFNTEIKQGDIIHVEANLNTAVITWKKETGQELGSYECPEIKDQDIQWVPYVELWKGMDQIQWIPLKSQSAKLQ